MKMTKLQKILSFFLCMVLISAMALSATACNGQENGGETDTVSEERTFTLVVKDADGEETSLGVTSNKIYVGAALLAQGIIEGDSGPFGLYIKKVNGILADYDVNGAYWAFYVNGEYATSGVDTTKIEDGATYSLVYTK